MRWGGIKTVMSISITLCGAPADNREGLEECKEPVLAKHCALKVLGFWIEASYEENERHITRKVACLPA